MRAAQHAPQASGNTAASGRVTRLRPFRGVRGWGVEVEAFGTRFVQSRPVKISLRSRGVSGLSRAYARVEVLEDGFRGFAALPLPNGAELTVTDEWRALDAEVQVARSARVAGDATDGFFTALALRRASSASWAEVEPFGPGAIYGNCDRVPRRAIGSAALRRSGIRYVLIREDRLAAPLFGVRYDDGTWICVLHREPAATTTALDCAEENGGETLTDERFGFAALGGVERDGGIDIGAWFPGSEGEITYTSGGLPLRQLRRWRRRYHPIRDGLVHEYSLAFRFGASSSATAFYRSAWRWAWSTLAPRVEPVAPEAVVNDCTSVLAAAAVSCGGRSGIPLELDATTGGSPETPRLAIMGFVGANTDAAYILLRVGREQAGEAARRYHELGERILDSFAAIRLAPPEAEGFDLCSGALITYRSYHGRPAVYARSVAEGCAAALDAWHLERQHGVDRASWLRWAQDGGEWILASQVRSGAFPRAWEARTGKVLDNSTSASYVPIPFLVALTRATRDTRHLEAAVRAGEFVWRHGGECGCFAGATLDNPDVVDKEAAVLSLEGFLELHAATGDSVWLERAVTAAELAETWIYVWNVPMPVDADTATLHWKPGVPTIGHQLIATGVSMSDAFLAVNAAAFARLFELTSDPHFLDVARVVTHGTKAMLARAGRTFDLHDVGWQQEHWSFAGRRGYGLNRNWLPWVSVAHVKGILRLHDLAPGVRSRVLDPASATAEASS